MTNESRVASKRTVRAIVATVISIILVVSVFASTAIAGALNEYDVKIIDNDKAMTVTTSETEPIEILGKANISLRPQDKLDISDFTQGEGGTIVVSRCNTMNVKANNKITAYNVYSATIDKALNEAGITLSKNDRINYKLTDSVIDGMVIDIKTAFPVTLTVDGKSTKYMTAYTKVSDLLKHAGVTLGDDDYTKPSQSSNLKSGMKITVYRVKYKTIQQTKSIPFKTYSSADSSMEVGKTKVTSKGENGSKDITYKVKYVNGKQVSKTTQKVVVAKKAKEQRQKVGTKQPNVTSNGVTSKNGYSVGQNISGRYTHYCACATCNGNSRGITTSGRRIYNGMANPYYVACNWLPLGSVIEVDGHNYTVVDRGGSGLSVQGRIDIFTPEGHAACYRYGTGSCSIKIVRLGW